MELADINSYRTIEELAAHQAEVRERIAGLDREFAGLPFSDEARSEWAGLQERDREIAERLTELRARHEIVQRLAGDERATESVAVNPRRRTAVTSRLPEDLYDLAGYRKVANGDEDYHGLLTDGARRAVELMSFAHERADASKNQGHLTRLLAKQKDDVLARHILTMGSPRYSRAFGKWLQVGKEGLSAEEMRALSTGVGSEGGFTVPVDLDPTLILTSDGAINPLRNNMARVETTTSNIWQAVTAGSVTASYSEEKTPIAKSEPGLGRPEVKPLRAATVIPFSIEIGQDWGRLQAEMARLIQDAKDVLEADKFVHGDGNGEPSGVIATLPAGSKIGTGASDTFDVQGIYDVKNATPPRFRARGQYLAEAAIYDQVRQFDEAGGSSLWVQLAADRPPTLVGYPARDISTMDATVEDGAEILLFGDFSQFVIVDRVGLAVELVPHLMDGDGNLTGERGLLAYWRNNSRILVPNAFRLLVVGTVGSGS